MQLKPRFGPTTILRECPSGPRTPHGVLPSRTSGYGDAVPSDTAAPKERLWEGVLGSLLLEIASGRREEGSYVREADVAAHWRCSRGVGRETLKAASERGVVRISKHRGARVLSRDSWDLLDGQVQAALVRAGEGDALAVLVREYLWSTVAGAAGLIARRGVESDSVSGWLALIGQLEDVLTHGCRDTACASDSRAIERRLRAGVIAASSNPLMTRTADVLEAALDVCGTSATTLAATDRIRVMRRLIGAIGVGDSTAAMGAALDAAAPGRVAEPA